MTRHYEHTLIAASERRQDAAGAIVSALQGPGPLEERLNAARSIREAAQRTLTGQTRPTAAQAAASNANAILRMLFDFVGQGFDADFHREAARTWAQTITTEDDAAAATNRLLRFGESLTNLQRAGALAQRALVEDIWPGLLTSWATGPLGGARGGPAAVSGFRAAAKVARNPERHLALADLETVEQIAVRIGAMPRSALREADDAAEAADAPAA